MAEKDLLTEAQVKHALRESPGWKFSGEKLQKAYRFETFTEAITFVDRIAEVAESLGHHPDIDIRYTSVALTLSSHDVGGVTDRDLELAKAIEAKRND